MTVFKSSLVIHCIWYVGLRSDTKLTNKLTIATNIINCSVTKNNAAHLNECVNKYYVPMLLVQKVTSILHVVQNTYPHPIA